IADAVAVLGPRDDALQIGCGGGLQPDITALGPSQDGHAAVQRPISLGGVAAGDQKGRLSGELDFVSSLLHGSGSSKKNPPPHGSRRGRGHSNGAGAKRLVAQRAKLNFLAAGTPEKREVVPLRSRLRYSFSFYTRQGEHAREIPRKSR